jgi:enediyne biosynthesis protein E4
MTRWHALAVVLALASVAVAAFTLFHMEDATPTVALGAPRFLDETTSSGIDHVYDGDFTYAVGGGVAVLDCDGSGKPDLYLAGGANPAALYRSDTPIGGDLKFSRIADPSTDLVGVLGAYPLDFDGDGITDLVVLRKGQSLVVRGLGNCRFAAGMPLGGINDWTTAFSATWEGSASLPTLALGHYLQLDSSGQPDPSYACADNLLYRPNPDGTAYGGPLALQPGYCSLSMLFSDWDRSGRRDLRVSNDRQYYLGGQDQLWRMAAGQPPRLYTDADGWVNLQIWGMGIASFDLSGKGYPDVFLTSQGDNKLQTLAVGPDQPTYRDMALRRGVTAAQPFTGGDVRPSTAWHPQFEDVNNDGFVDLFVSKGNVSSQPEFASRDPSNLFLGQPDGTFAEAAEAAGILNFDRGRGAALADFAMDGHLDLVELNYGAPTRVWRNVGVPGATANWLGVRVEQSGTNRDAIGAWLEVQVGKTTLRRELTVGGGHAGGQLGWTHFGLGAASEVQVRVIWPDGEIGAWQTASANQFVTIERGSVSLSPGR